MDHHIHTRKHTHTYARTHTCTHARSHLTVCGLTAHQYLQTNAPTNNKSRTDSHTDSRNPWMRRTNGLTRGMPFVSVLQTYLRILSSTGTCWWDLKAEGQHLSLRVKFDSISAFTVPFHTWGLLVSVKLFGTNTGLLASREEFLESRCPLWGKSMEFLESNIACY